MLLHPLLLLFLLLPSSLSQPISSQCLTGNPIDDCWLCSPSGWQTNLFLLSNCSLGFGRSAIGGQNGRLYTVTDPSDSTPSNPTPGTLRHAAIQTSPLWIIFSSDMTIRLDEPLFVNSHKTIDGRGATVHIAGGPCIIIKDVSNVIIHNLHIHDCIPSGDSVLHSSTAETELRGRSDGDGITIHGSRDVWIDHCSLSNCADGLIDVTEGSTRVTISNNFFSRHDKVMLLGHSDDYAGDSEMQVTVAFNRFGEELVQRMPRCRHGFFHVVNNDYREWGKYAVGGSANPTINSQGNRYAAPSDPNFKEVTKRMDTAEQEWSSWNWRSEGDIMLNGAFFVQSGQGSPANYEKASSFEPLSAELIDEYTRNAGVMQLTSGDDNNRSGGGGGGGVDGDGGAGGDNGGGVGGIVYGGGPPLPYSSAIPHCFLCHYSLLLLLLFLLVLIF